MKPTTHELPYPLSPDIMVDIPQTIHSTPQSKLTSQSLFDDPEDENDNEADVTKLIDKVNEMYHDLVGDSSHSPGVMESPPN